MMRKNQNHEALCPSLLTSENCKSPYPGANETVLNKSRDFNVVNIIKTV